MEERVPMVRQSICCQYDNEMVLSTNVQFVSIADSWVYVEYQLSHI